MQITMKQRIITSLGLSVLAGVSLVTPASAKPDTTTIDTFGTGGDSFTMNFVDIIGNPVANANDDTGYGGVANTFRMSTYEVSTAMVSKANTAGSLGITY